MPLLEKHLLVKRSTLKGSGKGLFTRKPIPKGTKIVEYKGRITTWKEVNDREGLNGYIYYVNRKHVIDAWGSHAALARYANDARGLIRTTGITNNSRYESEGRKVYIVASKSIPAGSEILVAYGKEYWDIIRENWKIKRLNGIATRKLNGAAARKLNGTGARKHPKPSKGEKPATREERVMVGG
jgi:SET domain-containing protein